MHQLQLYEQTVLPLLIMPIPARGKELRRKKWQTSYTSTGNTSNTARATGSNSSDTVTGYGKSRGGDLVELCVVLCKLFGLGLSATGRGEREQAGEGEGEGLNCGSGHEGRSGCPFP